MLLFHILAVKSEKKALIFTAFPRSNLSTQSREFEMRHTKSANSRVILGVFTSSEQAKLQV